MVHRFKAKAVIFMTAADPWSIMPLLSSSVPCVCMCYSEEHRKWFMKAAESVALRSFLDCQKQTLQGRGGQGAQGFAAQ